MTKSVQDLNDSLTRFLQYIQFFHTSSYEVYPCGNSRQL